MPFDPVLCGTFAVVTFQAWQWPNHPPNFLDCRHHGGASLAPRSDETPRPRVGQPIAWSTIYSPTAGIVEWQSTLDSSARAIEVDATHLGLTASLASFEAIVSVLA